MFAARLVPAAIAVLAVLPAPAHADIRAFNAAVQSGDYVAALAEAEATWPSLDQSTAAVAAREFAWIAMLAGDPTRALAYSRFLVEQGATLATPDKSPEVSRVLHAWAGLEAASSPGARTSLLTALQARAAIANRDLISPRAAQALQAEAWEAGDWPQAEAAAHLAGRFLDDLGATQSPARYEARRTQAMASFMRTKSPDAYTALYDAATELHELIATTPAGKIRDTLAREYFAALAWGDAVYSALPASRQRQVPDRRNTVGAGRPAMVDLLYPAPGDPALPRCRITMAKTNAAPGFPFVSRFKEFGGVVTYALDVNPNGTFANPRVMAAAPHPDFVEATQSVMSSWRWKLDASQTPSTCRMPQVHIATFAFAMGR
ncbi:MAG: energy transducer TonB [Hyphomonadaceae bacterium]